MFGLSDSKRVLVLIPAHTATGGTEALHTLVYELRRIGVNAFAVFVACQPGISCVAKRFEHFMNPICTFDVAIDTETQADVVVVPEGFTNEANWFRKARIVVWWLSVDNYTRPLRFCGPRTFINLLLDRLIKRNVDFRDKRTIHLCQSYYAMNFVRRKGAKRMAFLMDYLGEEHLKEYDPNSVRENVVLYNPAKGIHFTRKIMHYAGSRIRFFPLRGMSPEQVHEKCLHSKVYIDFGDHPGKDRFPREAAMAGCLIVTNRKGSAAFVEDVPIPDDYKFQDVASNVEKVTYFLLKCLDNYEEMVNDFDSYRRFIKQDRDRFLADIRAVFVEEKH